MSVVYIIIIEKFKNMSEWYVLRVNITCSIIYIKNRCENHISYTIGYRISKGTLELVWFF